MADSESQINLTATRFESVLTDNLHQSQQEPEALISRYQVEPGNEGGGLPPPDSCNRCKISVLTDLRARDREFILTPEIWVGARYERTKEQNRDAPVIHPFFAFQYLLFSPNLITMKLSSNNVFHYLLKAGMCQEQDMELMTIHPQPSKGRNSLIFLTVKLPSGRNLFIKQERHNYCDINNRVKNELRFQEFLRNSHDFSFILSLNLKIIYFDEPNSILIYEYPEDLINLESYYFNQKLFPKIIAESIGTTLADLHRQSLSSRNCYEFMNKVVEGKYYYSFPYPSHLLDRITLETLMEEFPPEGYRLIDLYQQSERLKSAVTNLFVTHNHFCLTHNNLQLNNLFIPKDWNNLLSESEWSDESMIKLINWESCSWGDPAFDLGTAIAGYLILWLNSLVIHPAIEFKTSLQLAIIPLEFIQPSVVVLIKSYLNNFPKVLEEYPDFLKRVVQFTGLALIYKIIIMIQSFQGFNNLGISALQLAKNLLCNPEESFKSIFGMSEAALIELIPLANVK